MILNLYKPAGITPLQLINKAKIKIPEISGQKLTYAGRLDPMAEGVLILLSGSDIKDKQKFLDLPKTYQFKVLLGVETDSYDVLGLINDTRLNKKIPNLENKINAFINRSLGKKVYSYPPFSSKPVNGKPLFYWAKEKKLDKLEIPKKEVEIFKFKLLEISTLNPETLKKFISKIRLVKGEFRQKEILYRWGQFVKKNKSQNFLITGLEINCSSGTYIRNIAYTLGKYLGTGGIALSIKRISVGDFTIEQSRILHF